nr:immunoglobulin heavy chain junction region [Macaca mulatta]MOX65257.1 immunoglobulin heavy chain junction region [Macaca mulatta]
CARYPEIQLHLAYFDYW